MSRIDKMVAELARQEPGFNISYKTGSKLMKFLGKLAFFNPDFMTKYATVVGDTVYFPNREFVTQQPKGKLVTIAHEYQHVKDCKRMSFPLFFLAYFSPQILAPFMLFFCFLYWWLGLLLFALFLSPIPSVGRMIIEKRGYIMTLFASNELYLELNLNVRLRRELLLGKIKRIEKEFITSSYYFMWPFGVKKELKEAVDKILSGEILQEGDSFLEVKAALHNSKL